MHLVDTTMFFAPQSGGVRRYLLAKRAWLQSHAPHVRHTLLVPYPQLPSSDLETCKALGVPIGGGYRFPLLSSRWGEALAALSPDVIEAGDPYVPAWGTLQAASRCGVPAVAFFHSDLPRMLETRLGGWAHAPARRYLRTLYAGFDLVLAPSQVMLEKLKYLGIEQAALQPLGVDVDIFEPRSRDAAVRGELGLPPDTRLLVFAGRFAREKHIDVLSAAVRRLGSGYHLLLIGAKQRSRPDPLVTMLPYEPQPRRLARWLASSDAFVHAGDEETFGLVLIEAMACGTPVVAVASGGTGELVRSEFGTLAARAGAAEMAEAITALFAKNLTDMRLMARQRALSYHSWSSAFEQQMRHYAHLRGEPQSLKVPLAYGER